MRWSLMDLCCVRIAVVRVNRLPPCKRTGVALIRELQPRFGVVPIMLVMATTDDLADVQSFSEFATEPYLSDLVEWNEFEPVEWKPLPVYIEPELPF